jgi:hypothetical protein
LLPVAICCTQRLSSAPSRKTRGFRLQDMKISQITTTGNAGAAAL